MPVSLHILYQRFLAALCFIPPSPGKRVKVSRTKPLREGYLQFKTLAVFMSNDLLEHLVL